jgi:hypothetical protein
MTCGNLAPATSGQLDLNRVGARPLALQSPFSKGFSVLPNRTGVVFIKSAGEPPIGRRFVPNPPSTAGTPVPAGAGPVDSAHRLNWLPKWGLRCQIRARPRANRRAKKWHKMALGSRCVAGRECQFEVRGSDPRHGLLVVYDGLRRPRHPRVQCHFGGFRAISGIRCAALPAPRPPPGSPATLPGGEGRSRGAGPAPTGHPPCGVREPAPALRSGGARPCRPRPGARPRIRSSRTSAAAWSGWSPTAARRSARAAPARHRAQLRAWDSPPAGAREKASASADGPSWRPADPGGTPHGAGGSRQAIAVSGRAESGSPGVGPGTLPISSFAKSSPSI